MTLALTTRWAGSQAMTVGLAGSQLLPPPSAARPVAGVVVVQTAGTPHRDLAGVESLLAARGCQWHYLITPGAMCDGRLVVWELATPGRWVSPLAPTGHLVVGVCGWYSSRWSTLQGAHVDPLTWVALGELVPRLLGTHGVHRPALCTGADLGQPCSPGDELEQWVRHYRRDRGVQDPRVAPCAWEPLGVAWPPGAYSKPTTCERAGALLARAGFHPSTGSRVWSDALHVACAAYQGHMGLPVTGALDIHTEVSLRRGAGDLVA